MWVIYAYFAFLALFSVFHSRFYIFSQKSLKSHFMALSRHVFYGVLFSNFLVMTKKSEAKSMCIFYGRIGNAR